VPKPQTVCMIITSENLSKPVDPETLETLGRVTSLAQSRDVPILLFGAFAREILFYYSHGIVIMRQTSDVDFSIRLRSWDEYEVFCRALLDNGFRNKEKAHREKFVDKATDLEMDILPFGGIAEDGKAIIWPEDKSEWTVLGLEDAYLQDLLFEFPFQGDLISIHIIPTPFVLLLKVFSLFERPEARKQKDALDIVFFIENYLQLVDNRIRLMEGGVEGDVMTLVENDLSRACCRLAGRDLAPLISKDTYEYFKEILDHEVNSGSRCELTKGLCSNYGKYCKGDFSKARKLVNEMLDGVVERSPW